jgi:hypothetical protein
VATSLQTCKLFVGFNFNQFSPATTANINSLTSQYGKAFEINQGTNQIEVTCPYVSTTPYKFMPNADIPSIFDSTGYVNIPF